MKILFPADVFSGQLAKLIELYAQQKVEKSNQFRFQSPCSGLLWEHLRDGIREKDG